MTAPKILCLDIETAPAKAWIWSLRDEYVPTDRIIDPTRILCWAAKWMGEPEVLFRAEWERGGPKAMLGTLQFLVSCADAVVTQNGDRFDLPRINGALLLHRLGPLPPVASIDVYKTSRNLGFLSSKLAYIGPLLGCGAKVKHEGFELWTKVMDGDKKARVRMERYNKQDVRVTERVYKKLRPFIKTHPWLGVTGSTSCPACGHTQVQRRGERRTKCFFIERLHCQKCGAWSDGARRKAK